MRPHVRVIAAVACTVFTATAATACSDGSSGSSAEGTSSPSASHAVEEAAKAAPATVTTKSVSLGKVLVNGKGRTLYLFLADTTSMSTCTGACAAAWPPLLTNGKPTGSGGVQSKLLSTSARPGGGGTQVTYNGHPLYLFSGDRNPGDTNGQGLNAFGAKWYVLGTDGKMITSGATTSPGGGGY